MNHITPTSLEREYFHINKISWSSILAGAFVGIGLGFLLHLYSTAIGLSAYSSSSTGASVIAIGGFLGLLVGTIASMLTSGFVSGYLGRYHYHHVSGGIIYGFITWSIALLLSVCLSSAMIDYTKSYTNSLTNTNVTTPKIQITLDKTDKADKTATNDKLSVPNDQNTTDATAKKVTPTELAGSGWVVFALFFIGALSSCIGAIWGMKCKKEEAPHSL